jgi:hypothetical protein
MQAHFGEHALGQRAIDRRHDARLARCDQPHGACRTHQEPPFVEAHAAMAIGVSQSMSAERAGRDAQFPLQGRGGTHGWATVLPLRNSAISGTEPHMQKDSSARGNSRGWYVASSSRPIERTPVEYSKTMPSGPSKYRNIAPEVGWRPGPFNDPLFVRTSEGMLPTPHATALVEPLRQAFELLRVATQQQVVFDPATSSRRFRISMTDISHLQFLPALMQRVGKLAPGIHIEMLRITAETPRLLEAGESDLAVGFMPEARSGLLPAEAL